MDPAADWGVGMLWTLLQQFGLGALLGLLLVTFVIGRVMPIDPVLKVVGERATPS